MVGTMLVCNKDQKIRLLWHGFTQNELMEMFKGQAAFQELFSTLGCESAPARDNA
jgi:hypothetical protein